MSTIRLLEVISEPSANQYLPIPFKVGEKVEYRGGLDESVKPETFRKQFIKIYRMKHKREESVSRCNFKILGNCKYDK